ncbi:MAG: MFS transporter [Gammaproteobacteria bacterium]|nr:MFS transporter [Gammaproteobacteria bacterium]
MTHVRRNILLLAVCQAVMMTGGSLLITSAAVVGAMLTEDRSLATLPLALQFLASMLTTIPASFAMRRWGRRAGFMLGVVIGAGGGVVAALAIIAGDFWLFCLGTALVGVFNGFGIYFRFAAVDAAPPHYKEKAISYVMAGGVVAAFAGPNLANLAQDLIPAATFAGSYAALVGLYGIALMALWFVDIPRAPAVVAGRHGRPLWQIARQPVFVVAMLGAMLGYGIMSLVMTATPLAMEVCGMPFSDSAFVIQWHVFAMFAPSFFTGTLIRHIGVVRVMLLGVFCYIATVVINLSGETVTHFWIALFLLGLGWNFLFVGGTDLLTETYREEEKAKAQALNDFMVFTTVSVSSLSAGALQFHYGWQAVNWGVTPLITVILVALLVLMWRRRGGHESAMN